MALALAQSSFEIGCNPIPFPYDPLQMQADTSLGTSLPTCEHSALPTGVELYDSSKHSLGLKASAVILSQPLHPPVTDRQLHLEDKP